MLSLFLYIKNKASRQDCNNYRGIALLSVVGKVLPHVILPRLQVCANLILTENQCGFWTHRLTMEIIFTLRQLEEKCLEQRKPLIVVFIDLTKAFDMVCWGWLFAILQRLGCPDTLLSIISGFHNHMQASVRYNGSTSKAFPVIHGVKQEWVLAPTLFAIYFSALLLRAEALLLCPFHPLLVFFSTHVTLRSCSIYFVYGSALRLARCLYVKCSMVTMRPLLPTVL